MSRLRDRNGVTEFVDDNAHECFVDRLGNTTCEGQPIPPATAVYAPIPFGRRNVAEGNRANLPSNRPRVN